MYKLPIGVDNFHKLVSNDYLFCDKSAMIAELLSKGDEVTLITRPCRWGKTLNISMLHHFLHQKSIEYVQQAYLMIWRLVR